MSGLFSRMFGNRLWKTVYHKIPEKQRENIRKAVDAADRVFTEEHAKETGIPVQPEQRPTMPQSQVDQEFRKKEDRVRKHHGNPKIR